MKLAIDLGSSETKIYRADANNGIALFEPSCVAISGEDESVCAIGKDAKKRLGRTTGDTHIIYPIYEGSVADRALAVTMLKKFIARAELSKYVRRSETVFAVPCGITDERLWDYKELATECGFKKVHFVEAPYLAVYGSGIILSDDRPVFTIDVGAGVTNIAVVTSGGMNAGISINVGGNAIDYSIAECIANVKGINIGTLTSERIKNEIGSLSDLAKGTTIVEGSSVSTCMPTATTVRSGEITTCVRMYIDKILEYAQLVLNQLPAEVAADIHRSGVLLTGGLAKISHIKEYFYDKLKMPITVADAPRFAVARGGGVALRDKKLLSRIELILDD